MQHRLDGCFGEGRQLYCHPYREVEKYSQRWDVRKFIQDPSGTLFDSPYSPLNNWYLHTCDCPDQPDSLVWSAAPSDHTLPILAKFIAGADIPLSLSKWIEVTFTTTCWRYPRCCLRTSRSALMSVLDRKLAWATSGYV